MDEEVAAIIRKKLKSWGDEKLNTAKLVELRKEITERTGKYKFAPFSNIKKWVREVKKTLSAEERPAKKTATAKVTPAEETAPLLSDRVFLQNISFEIAGMRRTLERISQQLDMLERQLALKRGASEA
ncbi:MAG: hypothetical protein QXG98_03805 [Candidatus Micrarchaeia archaeon]